jgi:hypothetical protein
MGELGGVATPAVGEGGAEMGAVLGGIAATDVRGGGAETRAVLAGAAAAVGVGKSGAEREAVLGCAAGLDARTSALGGALLDKSRLRPSPRATEKRIVKTVANGVPIASVKFFTQSICWFAMLVTGGSSVPPYFLCALIAAAKALFIAAPALLLAMTAPMTATMALTAAIIVASIVTVSCNAF